MEIFLVDNWWKYLEKESSKIAYFGNKCVVGTLRDDRGQVYLGEQWKVYSLERVTELVCA